MKLVKLDSGPLSERPPGLGLADALRSDFCQIDDEIVSESGKSLPVWRHPHAATAPIAATPRACERDLFELRRRFQVPELPYEENHATRGRLFSEAMPTEVSGKGRPATPGPGDVGDRGQLPPEGFETDPGGRPPAAAQVAPAKGDLLEGSAGTYRLVDHVSAGGMGTVWSAVEATRGTRAACKHLSVSDESEFRAASQVRPKHVVRYLDCVGRGALTEWLVMEWIDGGTLANWCLAGDHLDAIDRPGLFGILRGIANGLRDMHEVKLRHGDLKPENVLLVPTPDSVDLRPVIVDLGLAAGGERGQTISGPRGGTRGFQSPQQRRNESAAPEDDVWAYGCLVYYILRGELLEGTPDRLNEVNPRIAPAWQEFIEGCTRARREDRRFRDGSELLQGLEAVIAEQHSHQAKPAKPLPKPTDADQEREAKIEAEGAATRKAQQAEDARVARSQRMTKVRQRAIEGDPAACLEYAGMVREQRVQAEHENWPPRWLVRAVLHGGGTHAVELLLRDIHSMSAKDATELLRFMAIHRDQPHFRDLAEALEALLARSLPNQQGVDAVRIAPSLLGPNRVSSTGKATWAWPVNRRLQASSDAILASTAGKQRAEALESIAAQFNRQNLVGAPPRVVELLMRCAAPGLCQQARPADRRRSRAIVDRLAYAGQPKAIAALALDLVTAPKEHQGLTRARELIEELRQLKHGSADELQAALDGAISESEASATTGTTKA